MFLCAGICLQQVNYAARILLQKQAAYSVSILFFLMLNSASQRHAKAALVLGVIYFKYVLSCLRVLPHVNIAHFPMSNTSVSGAKVSLVTFAKHPAIFLLLPSRRSVAVSDVSALRRLLLSSRSAGDDVRDLIKACA
jgi:hypothetical protein